jgi:hypothetical protein
VPEVAAIIIVMGAIAVLWIDIAAVRMLLRNARTPTAVYLAPRDVPVEDRLCNAALEMTVMLELRACWFEPFPFDTQLPRIEQGRIVLPRAEPGVAPWSDAGVELPVVANDLTVGRFVLEPSAGSVGAVFSPTARERAVAMADELAASVAVALIRGDAARLRTPRPVRH